MSINSNLRFGIKMLLLLTISLSSVDTGNDHDKPSLDAPSAAPQISDLEMIDNNPTLYTRLTAGNQVALHNGTVDICGGTVLNARYILTSVQCVYDIHHPIPGPLFVLTATGKVAAEVKTLFIPQSFHESILLSTDIAVLKLDRDLPLGSEGLGQGAKLPEPVYDGPVYHTYENQEAIIVGHAPEAYDTHPSDSNSSLLEKPKKLFPKRLLIGKAKVLRADKCVDAWSGYMKMHEDPLCAKVPTGLSVQGFCRSDIGYGLLHSGTVIGVASFGNAFCHHTQAEKAVPATYTRVTLWLPFIRAAMTEDTASGKVRSYDLFLSGGAAAMIENDYWDVLWKSLVMIVAAMIV